MSQQQEYVSDFYFQSKPTSSDLFESSRAPSQEVELAQRDETNSEMDTSPNPQGGRKKPKKLTNQQIQKRQQQQMVPPTYEPEEDEDEEPQFMAPRSNRGRRIVPVHQSRIKDRPAKVGEKDSSLKIKIELDLEVEVEIYARVKGDVTIGLM